MFDSAFHSGDSIQGSPDIGATVTGLDPSQKYMADVEEYGSGVDVKSLCRVWDTWRERNSKNLIFILHGFWMLTEYKTVSGSPAFKEVDFLSEMLRGENEC